MTRNGITTTELVCATLIIAVIATILVPALNLVSRQNETSLEHLEASAVLGNILDDISTTSFADVTKENLDQTVLPDWAATQLTEARLVVTVTERDGAKQVIAEVSWLPSTSAVREKVRLQTWVFPGGAI